MVFFGVAFLEEDFDLTELVDFLLVAFFGLEAFLRSGSTAEDSRMASAGDFDIVFVAEDLAFEIELLAVFAFAVDFFVLLLDFLGFLTSFSLALLGLCLDSVGALDASTLFSETTEVLVSWSVGGADCLATFFFFILIADLQVDGMSYLLTRN